MSLVVTHVFSRQRPGLPMKSATVLEKIDDALNPIVVKELRQGVQSRFVVAVLLLFLLLQLMFMGIFLVVWSIGGQLEEVNVASLP